MSTENDYVPNKELARFTFPHGFSSTARSVVDHYTEYSTNVPKSGWVERWFINEDKTLMVIVSTPDD